MMKTKLLGLITLVSLLGLSPASAATYDYAIDFGLSSYQYGPIDNTVTGSIFTDCNNCVLDSSNIVSWSFTLTGSGGSGVTPPSGGISFSSNDPSAAIYTSGSQLPVTASGLNITYSPSPGPSAIGELVFCIGGGATCSFPTLGLGFIAEAGENVIQFIVSIGVNEEVAPAYMPFISQACVITSGASCVASSPPSPPPSAAPLPAALPLFATGLGALGLLGWCRKRKNAAAPAAA